MAKVTAPLPALDFTSLGDQPVEARRGLHSRGDQVVVHSARPWTQPSSTSRSTPRASSAGGSGAYYPYYPVPPPGSAPAMPHSARASLGTPKSAGSAGASDAVAAKQFERELAARVVVLQRALEKGRFEVARLRAEAKAAAEREAAAAEAAAGLKEELLAARRRICELEAEAAAAAAAPAADPLDEGWMDRYRRLKAHALRLRQEKELAERALRESLGPSTKWPAPPPPVPAPEAPGTPPRHPHGRPSSAPAAGSPERGGAGAREAEAYLRAATRLVRSLAAAARERAEATAELRREEEREVARLRAANLAARASRRVAALEGQLAELKAQVARLQAEGRRGGGGAGSPRRRGGRRGAPRAPAGVEGGGGGEAAGEEEEEEEEDEGVDLMALLARHVGQRAGAGAAAPGPGPGPQQRPVGGDAAGAGAGAGRSDDEGATDWSGEGDPEDEYDEWLAAREIKPRWQAEEGGEEPPGAGAGADSGEDGTRRRPPRVSRRLERLAQSKPPAAPQKADRADASPADQARGQDFHAAFERIETDQRAKWAASERETAARERELEAALAAARAPPGGTGKPGPRGNRRRSTATSLPAA
eukprot:tig00000361_g24407.t1